MDWYVWVAVAVAAYFAYAFSARNRNRRVWAEITIPARGTPTIQISPTSASPADLCLAALCYASKIRWLVNSEFTVSKDILRELLGEACDFWDEGAGDLIDRMPTAAAIRRSQAHPRAVDAGEVFRVSFFRTEYSSLQNRAWIMNTIPRPGLAANLPWSVILLMNSISAVLPDEARAKFGKALRNWVESAMDPAFDDQTQVTLTRLFELSVIAYDEA